MTELEELINERGNLEYILEDVEIYPNFRLATEAKLEYVKQKIKHLTDE